MLCELVIMCLKEKLLALNKGRKNLQLWIIVQSQLIRREIIAKVTSEKNSTQFLVFLTAENQGLKMKIMTLSFTYVNAKMFYGRWPC